MTASASSSMYSIDRKDLGYTPFEYWKGPKPVSWAVLKQENAKKASEQRRIAAHRKSLIQWFGSQGNSPSQFARMATLQPVHLHAAQQFDAWPASPYDELFAPGPSHSNTNFSNPEIAELDSAGGKGGTRVYEMEGTRVYKMADQAHGLPSSPPPRYGKLDLPAIFTQHFNGVDFDHFDSVPTRSKKLAKIGLETPDPEVADRYHEDESSPWFDFQLWSKRRWAFMGIWVLLVIVIVTAIPVVVVQSATQSAKANAYHNYSKLSYGRKDSCIARLCSIK